MSSLYRGVSAKLYNQLNGILKPKKVGRKFASAVVCGSPHAVCGSGIVCGESFINEVISHQWNQKGFPTSGISTSPHFERAKFYALAGDREQNGYVYQLSIQRLVEYGVSIYRVSDFTNIASVRDDNEHIIVAPDFGCIPAEAVVKILEVAN